MDNFQNAGYGQDIHDSAPMNLRSSDAAYSEPFPISDFGEEEISLEDFEKLSGTSYIDFLRSQDDMI